MEVCLNLIAPSIIITNRYLINVLLVSVFLITVPSLSGAQQIYLPGLSHPIPDPFLLTNGKKVETKAQWYSERRPELLHFFTTQVYGKTPARPGHLKFKIFDIDKQALSGLATRKQVAILVEAGGKTVRLEMLIYLPNQIKSPVPLFVGLNFEGNQTINKDTAIRITGSWLWDGYKGVKNNRATNVSRGVAAARWPIKMILKRGYGIATICAADIAPDRKEGYQAGVQSLYPELQKIPDNFATVAAWAWGLSRAMDYFETDEQVDSKRVAVFGWSRMGKAALWAGARDQRFAAVISNESGAGGAKLFHHFSGENIHRLCTIFPYWFCRNFQQYNGKDTVLPFDQHELVALIAPRPVYIASAEEDHNADPCGEFLTAVAVDTVYRFLCGEGFPIKQMPPVNHPVFGRISYHIRSGKHNITPYDWKQYLHFAAIFLRKKSKAFSPIWQ